MVGVFKAAGKYVSPEIPDTRVVVAGLRSRPLADVTQVDPCTSQVCFRQRPLQRQSAVRGTVEAGHDAGQSSHDSSMAQVVAGSRRSEVDGDTRG